MSNATLNEAKSHFSKSFNNQESAANSSQRQYQQQYNASVPQHSHTSQTSNPSMLGTPVLQVSSSSAPKPMNYAVPSSQETPLRDDLSVSSSTSTKGPPLILEVKRGIEEAFSSTAPAAVPTLNLDPNEPYNITAAKRDSRSYMPSPRNGPTISTKLSQHSTSGGNPFTGPETFSDPNNALVSHTNNGSIFDDASSISSRHEKEDPMLAFGKFSIDTGFPDCRSDLEKNIVFVPKSLQEGLGQQTTSVTNVIKKIWGIGDANMVLKLNAGSRHPKSLVNSLLSETEGYSQWKKDALLQVQRKEKLVRKRIWKPRIKATSAKIGPSLHHAATHVIRAQNTSNAFRSGLPDKVLNQPTPLSKKMQKQLSRSASSGLFSEDSAVVREESVGDKLPTDEKYKKLSDYNRFRVDESGFSSGDSSTTNSDVDLESETSSEDEATEGAKKKKLAIQTAATFQKRLMDVDGVSTSDDDDEDFLPTHMRRMIIHNTKDTNNVETILSDMLFERLVNVYVTVIEGEV